jgi:hypothetical protein
MGMEGNSRSRAHGTLRAGKSHLDDAILLRNLAKARSGVGEGLGVHDLEFGVEEVNALARTAFDDSLAVG